MLSKYILRRDAELASRLLCRGRRCFDEPRKLHCRPRRLRFGLRGSKVCAACLLLLLLQCCLSICELRAEGCLSIFELSAGTCQFGLQLLHARTSLTTDSL